MKKRIGIFIYDDAEVLDFAGPFEVFSVTSQLEDHSLAEVFTVAPTQEITTAVNGLKIMPDYSIHHHPPIDILIISGGQGSKVVMNESKVIEWLIRAQASATITLSICSGARFLAKANLLDHRPFCTHHEVYEHVMQLAPTAIPCYDQRFIQTSETIYTSGGISAGIDLSFFIVEKMWGASRAHATASYMEYYRSEQVAL